MAIITHITNLDNGIIAVIPKLANVVAIRQNTPIGANFITRYVILIIILFASTKKSFTALTSSCNIDMTIPTINANIIVGIISPLANELTGFEGIMFKRLSVNVTLLVMFVEYTDVAMFKPIPGLIIAPIAIAIQTAINVVNKYNIITSTLIFPIFLLLDKAVVPTTIEQNTNGTTNIFIRFMNAVPPK